MPYPQGDDPRKINDPVNKHGISPKHQSVRVLAIICRLRTSSQVGPSEIIRPIGPDAHDFRGFGNVFPKIDALETIHHVFLSYLSSANKPPSQKHDRCVSATENIVTRRKSLGQGRLVLT